MTASAERSTRQGGSKGVNVLGGGVVGSASGGALYKAGK